MVKTVWSVFDQLNMERAIELDSCYRTGSSGGGRPRPITVVFVKQADRDLVYSRRMELKRSLNHKQVWINEDLGPASKKARNMIRLISRQAQAEGIDHRTGKYAIFINRRKYDESNLTDLPPPPPTLNPVRKCTIFELLPCMDQHWHPEICLPRASLSVPSS